VKTSAISEGVHHEAQAVVFVKYFHSPRHISGFTLSDGTFQAIFSDESEMLFSQQNQTIAFIDKRKKLRWY
jgi:hypothetical protein